jgi:uncharacterized membrane protein
VWGHLVYLADLRLIDGELLIVATTELSETTITKYWHTKLQSIDLGIGLF